MQVSAVTMKINVKIFGSDKAWDLKSGFSLSVICLWQVTFKDVRE